MVSYQEQLSNELEQLAAEGISILRDVPSAPLFEIAERYQNWYSRALATMQSFLPERISEFTSYYHNLKRKTITIETYSISDYMLGIVVNRGNTPIFDTAVVMQSKFQQQVFIIKSIQPRLNSLLGNIHGILQADLFDSELSAARELLRNGHIRAAGALSGVVLEKHLGNVCQTHGVDLKRKKPTISNFNDGLKDQEIVDIPTWRLIQRLGDFRNLCSHAGEREPTNDDVQILIDGTDQVMKTVF